MFIIILKWKLAEWPKTIKMLWLSLSLSSERTLWIVLAFILNFMLDLEWDGKDTGCKFLWSRAISILIIKVGKKNPYCLREREISLPVFNFVVSGLVASLSSLAQEVFEHSVVLLSWSSALNINSCKCFALVWVYILVRNVLCEMKPVWTHLISK